MSGDVPVIRLDVPADRLADLRVGDRVVEIDGQPILARRVKATLAPVRRGGPLAVLVDHHGITTAALYPSAIGRVTIERDPEPGAQDSATLPVEVPRRVDVRKVLARNPHYVVLLEILVRATDGPDGAILGDRTTGNAFANLASFQGWAERHPERRRWWRVTPAGREALAQMHRLRGGAR